MPPLRHCVCRAALVLFNVTFEFECGEGGENTRPCRRFRMCGSVFLGDSLDTNTCDVYTVAKMMSTLEESAVCNIEKTLSFAH